VKTTSVVFIWVRGLAAYIAADRTASASAASYTILRKKVPQLSARSVTSCRSVTLINIWAE